MMKRMQDRDLLPEGSLNRQCCDVDCRNLALIAAAATVGLAAYLAE
jgi:hypothetical protein